MIVTILVEFPVVAALAHMASFTRSNLQIVAGEIPNYLRFLALKATVFCQVKSVFGGVQSPHLKFWRNQKLFVGLIAIVRMNQILVIFCQMG